jgi:hypothetical protein
LWSAGCANCTCLAPGDASEERGERGVPGDESAELAGGARGGAPSEGRSRKTTRLLGRCSELLEFLGFRAACGERGVAAPGSYTPLATTDPCEWTDCGGEGAREEAVRTRGPGALRGGEVGGSASGLYAARGAEVWRGGGPGSSCIRKIYFLRIQLPWVWRGGGPETSSRPPTSAPRSHPGAPARGARGGAR